MTRDDLKSKLLYEPDTGIFRWRVTRPGGMQPGDVAGWHNGKNMRRINFGSKCYLAHRLAWFYVHGEWPEQVDHINGDRADNRLCNLRPATNGQNQANTHAKPNNRLGVRGVGFRDGKYIVQLKKGDERVRKAFTTLQEAQSFAASEHRRLHGEFSVHNRSSA